MINLAGAPWAEKPSLPERILKVGILAVIFILVVYPFICVLATSLATESDVIANGGLVLWPAHPTLDAYQTILQGGVVTHAVIVSVLVTVIGTLASMAVSVALAYGLSRPIVGSRGFVMVVLFTLFFFPGIIPNYLMVKQLGLLNNYVALIIPTIINAFNVVILRQFFQGIPQELVDSARIDGAGDMTILLKIILPLSKAVLAVIALFYAVTYWNSWFNALLYLNDSSTWPLPLVLRLYVIQGAHLPGAMSFGVDTTPPPEQAIQMAVVVIAVVPILLVYPFLQKYFTTGVLSGAIKG